MTSDAIHHRTTNGRLHRVWSGVYVVGSPLLTRPGFWMAAVLSCGADAVLSHLSGAALWGIREQPGARSGAPVDVTVPSQARRRRPGIRLHRRDLPAEDRTRRYGIAVTSPARTLIDLATLLRPRQLEVAANQADKLGLVDPERLREVVAQRAGVPGVAALRSLLDRRTFRLTDSELERRFLHLVRRAGLPVPETGRVVNGFKTDFWWPELGLVVETDGLRYHRTPGKQARDRERDQAHIAAGLTPLRFTHAQVRFEPDRVVEILKAVVRRLRGGPKLGPRRAA